MSSYKYCIIQTDEDDFYVECNDKATYGKIYLSIPQTRSQTETTDKCPFTVVERKVTYRIVPHNEWCSPEMEKKWNEYLKLKKEIGEARYPDKLD